MWPPVTSNSLENMWPPISRSFLALARSYTLGGPRIPDEDYTLCCLGCCHFTKGFSHFSTRYLLVDFLQPSLTDDPRGESVCLGRCILHWGHPRPPDDIFTILMQYYAICYMLYAICYMLDARCYMLCYRSSQGPPRCPTSDRSGQASNCCAWTDGWIDAYGSIRTTSS